VTVDNADKSPPHAADVAHSHLTLEGDSGQRGLVSSPLLFLNVLVIATCGLIYELLAGTLASYVLGDSVTQFSLCIGIYLSAMGAGAWLSGFVNRTARCFIEVELGVALLGGISAPTLFLMVAHPGVFHLVLYGLVFVIGTLVGLELPLLMRILKEDLDFKDLVSRVLTFDYLGALAASVLFPLIFVPKLGLVRTSLLFGALNAVVGLWGTWLLRPLISGSVIGLRVRAVLLLALLIAGMFLANHLTSYAEERQYGEPIVHAESTAYQRIVVTSRPNGFRLYLNGKLQLSSQDEYRYHEALVHPAMSAAQSRKHVVILGGGDGLALREVLKYSDVERVTLVDLDPGMTRLSSTFPPLAELNRHAYDDPRVTVVNQDAFLWIEASGESLDVVIIDFPDPASYALGKLYTRRFYRMLRDRMSPGAAISIQCTSPLYAKKTYWCIINTMQSAGLAVRPFHTAVPSFGVWGFGLAKESEFEPPQTLRPELAKLRYLNNTILPELFRLPADLQPMETEINRLDNQSLVRYYDEEWRAINQVN